MSLVPVLSLLPLLASTPAQASCPVKVQLVNQTSERVGWVNDVEQMADAWYESMEATGYTKPGETSNLGCTEVGHYTQLVWSESRYIGCGLHAATDDSSWTRYYLVCDYASPDASRAFEIEPGYDKAKKTVTVTVKPKK